MAQAWRYNPNVSQDKSDLLAYRLFRQFAKTEYALKECLYLEPESKWAKPNWDQFAERHGGIWDDPKIREARDYIVAHPPARQMNENGRAIFEKQPKKPTNAKELLCAMRTIRNNLFHGGKRVGFLNDPRRDEPLMCHALAILEACLRADAELESAYHH